MILFLFVEFCCCDKEDVVVLKDQQRRLLLLFDCWFSQCCSTGLGFRGVFELDPVTTSRRFSIEFLLPKKT